MRKCSDTNSLVFDDKGMIVQTPTIIWQCAERHQPRSGVWVWVVVELVSSEYRQPGERDIEFIEFAEWNRADNSNPHWMYVGGGKIGPYHRVVAWAYPPQIPPRFVAES